MKKYYRINNKNSYFQIIENQEGMFPGVYCVTEKYNEKTNKTQTEFTHICSVAWIESKIKSGNTNYYCVCFNDRELHINKKYISAQNLLITSSKNTNDIDLMIKSGFIITERQRSLVLEYFKTTATFVPEIQGTDQMGWHGEKYIADGYNTSDIVYTGNSDVVFSQKGSAEAQFKFFRTIFSENPLVFFLAAYNYSGMLLHWMTKGEANSLVGITGLTSIGKTLALKVITSGFQPSLKFKSLNGTAGAIQSLAHMHSDYFICFDETKQTKVKPDDMETFMYNLSNGQDTNRLRKFGDDWKPRDIEIKQYCITFAGEISMFEGLKTREGMDVRYNEFTLSNNTFLWDGVRSNEDAEEISRFIKENYGFVGPKYLKLAEKECLLLKDKYQEKLVYLRNKIASKNDRINRKIGGALTCSMVAADLLTRVLFPNESEKFHKAYVMDMENAAIATLIPNNQNFVDSGDTYKDALSHVENTLQAYFITDSDDVNKKEILGKITINAKKCEKIIDVYNNQFGKFCVLLGVPEKIFVQYLRENKLLKIDADGKSTIKRAGKRYYSLVLPDSYFDDELDTPKAKTKEELEREEMQEVVPPFDGELPDLRQVFKL